MNNIKKLQRTITIGKYTFYLRGPFNLLTLWGWRSLLVFDLGYQLPLFRVGPIGWHKEQ